MHRRRLALVVCCALWVTTSCGTRLAHTAVTAVSRTAGEEPRSTGARTSVDEGITSGPRTSVGTTSANPTQTRSGKDPGRATTMSAGTVDNRGPVVNGSRPATGVVRSPVRIASVGTYSGPI